MVRTRCRSGGSSRFDRGFRRRILFRLRLGHLIRLVDFVRRRWLNSNYVWSCSWLSLWSIGLMDCWWLPDSSAVRPLLFYTRIEVHRPFDHTSLYTRFHSSYFQVLAAARLPLSAIQIVPNHVHWRHLSFQIMKSQFRICGVVFRLARSTLRIGTISRPCTGSQGFLREERDTVRACLNMKTLCLRNIWCACRFRLQTRSSKWTSQN